VRYVIAISLLILAGPATLAVEDGKLALTGPPTLVRANLPATIPDAEILFSLRSALQRVGLPYQAGMSRDEKDADAANTDRSARRFAR
jgi:hypothetical protein